MSTFPENKMNTDQDKLPLHFKYCAFIAIMVIIAIATERWSTNKDFTTYLSNAATMTSLFLGVVAIFYSFIANDGMSRSLGSITTVSTEVREARQEIGKFVQLTQVATDASANNATLVREASSNLSSSLESLDDTLRALSTQNETLKTLVSSLPVRMDQLESKFGDVAKALGEKPEQPPTPTASSELPASVVTRFLRRSTLYQNLIAHACVLADSKKKEFSIPDFCSKVDYAAPSNFAGFLSCMDSAQLCNRKVVSGQERTYKISNVHSQLKAQSRSYFVEYIEHDYEGTDDEKNAWLKKLAAVEALFE